MAKRKKPEVWRHLKPRDFMGTSEVADMLGVERPRIGRWLTKEAQGKAKRLPDPVARLKMSPVFLREHIKLLKKGVPPEEIEVTPLDLVGVREAAEDVLDFQADRIGAWRREGVMPKPITRLRAGPLWWRPDIEALKPQRERRRRRVAAPS